MKLRLHAGSLRLRLGPAEVNSLMNGEAVAESLRFGPEPWEQLHYVLQIDHAQGELRAELAQNTITVRVPAAMIQQWGESDEVAIEAQQHCGREASLKILIEKDFACLHGDRVNDDVYPNPLETA